MAGRNSEVDVSRFIYDPETGIVRRLRKTDGRYSPFGYVNHHGYLAGKIDGVNVQVHRLAWRLHYGVWPEVLSDHKDKGKTNNRILNLRESTDALNRANKSRQLNNTSGFKGVYLDKTMVSRPWAAKITRDRKRYMIFHFKTPELATAAYE